MLGNAHSMAAAGYLEISKRNRKLVQVLEGALSLYLV